MSPTHERDSQRLRPIAVALAQLAGNVAAFRDLVQQRRALDDPMLEALHVPLHGINALVEQQTQEPPEQWPASTVHIYVQATLRTVLALSEGGDEAEVTAARDVGRAAEDLLRVTDSALSPL